LLLKPSYPWGSKPTHDPGPEGNRVYRLQQNATPTPPHPMVANSHACQCCRQDTTENHILAVAHVICQNMHTSVRNGAPTKAVLCSAARQAPLEGVCPRKGFCPHNNILCVAHTTGPEKGAAVHSSSTTPPRMPHVSDIHPDASTFLGTPHLG
jgi:hypothetical protein